MLGKTKDSGKRQAPIYSMTGRSKTGSFHEDLQKTPGPGTYDITEPSIYKDKAALYSMTSRNVMPGDTTQKPGPGAHSPEKVSTMFQQGLACHIRFCDCSNARHYVRSFAMDAKHRSTVCIYFAVFCKIVGERFSVLPLPFFIWQ